MTILRLRGKTAVGLKLARAYFLSRSHTRDLRMTSKSVHRAIPLGFREKPNLRPAVRVRPDVYLHSATEKERGFRGEKTESLAFVGSTAHLIPSYFVSAQIFFVRSPNGPAIIFKAEWMERPFSHLGIYTSAGIIFSDHDCFQVRKVSGSDSPRH